MKFHTITLLRSSEVCDVESQISSASGRRWDFLLYFFKSLALLLSHLSYFGSYLQQTQLRLISFLFEIVLLALDNFIVGC